MKALIRLFVFLFTFCTISYILFYILPNFVQLKQSYDLFYKKYPTIPFYKEVGERLNVYHNIEPSDKVLEIGGNIGSTSLIIADKLNKNIILILIFMKVV